MPAVELEVYLNYVLPWGSEHAHLYKCVTTFWTNQDGQRCRLPVNEAVKGYDELVDLIEARSRWREADVYLAQGTQRVADTKESRDGRAVRAQRSARNMATFNSLFVDVDVKDYESVSHAEAAADAFLKVSGMPAPSMRVRSGSGGFHDYWCFDRAMDKDNWLVLAEALKRAAKHHGFTIDDAVTADAARILRIPTTLNHKHNPPRPCKLDIPVTKRGRPYTHDELTLALQAFMKVEKKTGTGPSATVSSIGANFTDGAETKRPPVSIDAVAKNCPMTAQTLGNGGAGKSEPEWQMDIYLAAFTSDPRMAAHKLSSGHKDYDFDKTEEKLAQKQAAIKAGNMGWPECARFNHAACKTCRLREKGKSPLHFAQEDVGVHPKTDPGEDEIMPRGYFRNQDDWVIDGDKYIPVVPYPLLDAFVDGDTNEPVIKYRAGGKEHFGAISLSKQGPTGIAEAWTKATNNTMLIHPKNLGVFMMSFVQKLQSLGDRRIIRPTGMGWDDEGNFVFDEVYMPNGTKAAYRSRDIIDLNYKRKGSIEPWHAAMELIYGNTVMEILVASAFAAPLVSFSANFSVILSIYSSASAFGKTTAISIAQAVWAQPERMSQIQDTTNSVMGKLAALRHLPLYWDELKLQEEMEEIVKIVFRVISGRDKSRMKQDASLRKQAEVARTMMAVCSNQSVQSMAVEATEGTDAGGLRVFEMQADPLIRKPGVNGEQLLLPLDRNFGMAGSAYAMGLVKNRAALEGIVKQVDAQFESAVHFHQSERFWRVTMVSITAGAMIANALKITRFDVDAIQKRLISTLEKLRLDQGGSQTHSTTTTHSAVGIFNEMINELAGRKNLVFTDQIFYGRGRPTKPKLGDNFGPVGSRADYNEIIAQEGRTDGRRLVKKRFFHKWMKDHHRQPGQILQLLMGEYKVVDRRATLCAGVPLFEQGQIDCYDFTPLNHNPSSPSASSD